MTQVTPSIEHLTGDAYEQVLEDTSGTTANAFATVIRVIDAKAFVRTTFYLKNIHASAGLRFIIQGQRATANEDWEYVKGSTNLAAAAIYRGVTVLVPYSFLRVQIQSQLSGVSSSYHLAVRNWAGPAGSGTDSL